MFFPHLQLPQPDAILHAPPSDFSPLLLSLQRVLRPRLAPPLSHVPRGAYDGDAKKGGIYLNKAKILEDQNIKECIFWGSTTLHG